MKTEEIRVLLTPEQRENLDELRGIAPISAYIRSLIERAWEEHEYCECTESDPRPELNAVGRAEWRCAKCGGRAIGDDGEE